MSFECNPAEEYPDPHDQCRFEIRRLTAENAKLREIVLDAFIDGTMRGGTHLDLIDAQRLWDSSEVKQALEAL